MSIQYCILQAYLFCFSQINDYVSGVGCDVPLLLIGGAGSGKSSVMSRLADLMYEKSLSKQIPG